MRVENMMNWCLAAENREEKLYSCSPRKEQRGCKDVSRITRSCYCNTNLCNRPNGQFQLQTTVHRQHGQSRP